MKRHDENDSIETPAVRTHLSAVADHIDGTRQSL